MSFLVGYVTGATITFGIMAFCFWGPAADTPRNACRAANPGYDCTLGWVKGEAFK